MLMILLGGWAFVIRINYLIGCIYFCERIYQTELPASPGQGCRCPLKGGFGYLLTGSCIRSGTFLVNPGR